MPDDDQDPLAPIELGEKPMVLLGAGASVEAGIPATVGMTQQLVERIGRGGYHSQASKALNYVCAALVAHDAARGINPSGALDVERVFAAIELLAERGDLEVSPFVASWDAAVDAWDRGPGMGFFERNLAKAVLTKNGRGAQSEIEKLIRSMTGTGTGATYKYLASEMITELRTLLAGHRKSLGYLAPLVRLAHGTKPLTIATLNYDLSIEQAGDGEGIMVETGIDAWIADRRWPRRPDEGVRLLKLHGSIDWCWEQVENEDGQMPMRDVVLTDSPESETRAPVLVFGQRGKLQAEGPFLSLLAEFEAALAEADRLIVVGYSFRDMHVNDIVQRWTRADKARTIVMVDPNPDGSSGYRDFRSQMLHHLNPPRSGLRADGLGRIDVRRLKASEAFALLSRSN
jgi:NAD-dependent SIR2 family protein deacetylase